MISKFFAVLILTVLGGILTVASFFTIYAGIKYQDTITLIVGILAAGMTIVWWDAIKDIINDK